MKPCLCGVYLPALDIFNTALGAGFGFRPLGVVGWKSYRFLFDSGSSQDANRTASILNPNFTTEPCTLLFTMLPYRILNTKLVKPKTELERRLLVHPFQALSPVLQALTAPNPQPQKDPDLSEQ